MDEQCRRDRERSTLVIDANGIFNPTKFLGPEYSTWKGPVDGDGLRGAEDRDDRNFMLHALAFSGVEFVTGFNGVVKSIIDGEEKLFRLRSDNKSICLGGDTFLSLWLDYNARGDASVLEWLRNNREIEYLDFFGIVLRKEQVKLDAIRCVPFFRYDKQKKEWRYGCSWLAFSWLEILVSVVLPIDSNIFMLRNSYATAER